MRVIAIAALVAACGSGEPTAPPRAALEGLGTPSVEHARRVILDVNAHVVAMARPEVTFDSAAIVAAARAIDPAVVAAPAAFIEVRLQREARMEGVLLKAVSYEGRRLRTDLERYIVAGTAALEGDELPLLLGEGLARSLGVKPGDPVAVVPAGPDGVPAAPAAARVTAILDFDFAEYDTRLALTSLAAARRLPVDQRAEVVELKLAEPGDAGRFAAQLRARLGAGHTVLDWCELNRALFEALRVPCS